MAGVFRSLCLSSAVVVAVAHAAFGQVAPCYTRGKDIPASAGLMALSPDGDTLYLLGQAATLPLHRKDLWVIDAATETVRSGPHPMPAGGNTFGMDVTPNGSHVFFTSSEVTGSRGHTGITNHLVMVDATTLQYVKISMGFKSSPWGATGVAVTPDGTRVYIPDHGDQVVWSFDIATRAFERIGLPTRAEPMGIDITPDGSKVWVADGILHLIHEIDTATNTRTRSVSWSGLSASHASSRLRIHPDGKFAYLVHGASPGIFVLDLDAGVLLPTTSTPAARHNGFAMSADGRALFACTHSEGRMDVFSVDPQAPCTVSFVESVAIPYPGRVVAQNERGIAAFVASGNGFVSVIHGCEFPTCYREREQIPGVTGIMTLSPDGDTLYVLGQAATLPLHRKDLWVVDAATRTVKSGPHPMPAGGNTFDIDVTPSGSHVFFSTSEVTGSRGHTGITNHLVMVDTATLQYVKVNMAFKSSPWGPTGVAVTPDGARVYIPDHGDQCVWSFEIATRTFQRIGLPTRAEPMGIDITPDGSRVWVADGILHLFHEIDTATNTRIRSISWSGLLTQHASSKLRIHPNGKFAYAVQGTTPGIFVLDVDAGVQLSTVATPALRHNGLAIDPCGRRLFTCTASEARMDAFAIDPGSPATVTYLSTVTVTDPARVVAQDEHGIAAFVSSANGDYISVVEGCPAVPDPDPDESTLVVDVQVISAAVGASGATATVVPKDDHGDDLGPGLNGVEIELVGGGGQWNGPVMDNGDGSYSRTLAGDLPARTVTVEARIGAVTLSQTRTVDIVDVDPFAVSITLSYEQTVANGVILVTVEPKDCAGQPIGTGHDVVIATSLGSMDGSVRDEQDGRYTQNLLATTIGTASITVIVDGLLLDDGASLLVMSATNLGTVVGIDVFAKIHEYMSIQHAIQSSAQDDVQRILIQPGVYEEKIELKKGKCAEGLTIEGLSAVGSVVLRGVKIKECNGITIRFLTLEPSKIGKGHVLEIDKATDCTIAYCQVSGAGHGIHIKKKVEVSIEDCLVCDNKKEGMKLGGESTVTITHCVIENNGRNGIDIKKDCTATISACLIRGNGTEGKEKDGYGIYIEVHRGHNHSLPTDFTLIDNTIEGNRGLVVPGQSDANVANYDWIIDVTDDQSPYN